MKFSKVLLATILLLGLFVQELSAVGDDIYIDDVNEEDENTRYRRQHVNKASKQEQEEEEKRSSEKRKERERERAAFTSPRGGEFEEEMRMKISSCIYLTKIKLSNSQRELSSVADTFRTNTQTQTKVFRKITGELMDKCMNNIDLSTAQRFLEEANREKGDKFDFSSFDFVFDKWSHKKYLEKNVDFTLTQEQEVFTKYMDEFDKMMAEKEGRSAPSQQEQGQGQGQEEEDYFYKEKPEDREPKIFGVSLKLDSPTLQMIYVGAFVVLVLFVIYYGLKQIQILNQPLDRKRKKNKNK